MEPCGGSVVLDLPEGEFAVTCVSPVTGGPETAIDLPDFRHDLVVRVMRKI